MPHDRRLNILKTSSRITLGVATLALLAASVPLGYAMPLGAPAAASDAATTAALTERANAILNGPAVQGRTAAGWIAWIDDEVVAAEPSAARDVELADAVLALYATMGLAASEADVAAIRAAAASLDPALAAPFGALVAETAAVYAVQAEIAERVMAKAHGMAPEDVYLALDFSPALADPTLASKLPVDGFVTVEDSLLMQENAARLLSAIATFRAAVPEETRSGGGAPLFSDPNALVLLGGPDDTTFTRSTSLFKDAVLAVDVGGNDYYGISAGGACPDFAVNLIATCNGLAVSVNVDLTGNDVYEFSGLRSVAQGASSTGGLGLLVDDSGDDHYTTYYNPEKDSVLMYYIQGVSQGAGQAGLGLLLDATGNDRYDFFGTTRTPGRQVFVLAQGYGGVGGTGALVDLLGDDRYVAIVDVPSGSDFSGVYTLGTALYAAVGIVYDHAGNDYYYGEAIAPQSDYYAQGFGAFNAMGIQVDPLGDDEYLAIEVSTNESFGQSLNCAYGTAFFSGVGVFLDLVGDDSYLTRTTSWERTSKPAGMSEGWSETSYSLFVDGEGDDDHVIESFGRNPMATGRGIGSHPGLSFLISVTTTGAGAVYLDLGGVDRYVGAPPSKDNGQWLYGADVNAVPDYDALGLPF